MPILDSTYTPPFGLSNRHLQTLLAGFLRKAPRIVYERQRIATFDDDFIDLDWSKKGHARIAIISYGMEGTSDRPYVRGMVSALNNEGWDVVVWNYRGCSGEPNRKIHFYHGGLTADLYAVVAETVRQNYSTIVLIGFSLGGNLVLNYLGRRDQPIPPEIKKAVAISAPCDVADCAEQLRKPSGKIYTKIFLRAFREKIRAKMKIRPNDLNDIGYDKINCLEDYDQRYTVPHFGFESAIAFYKWVSSRQHVPRINIPTLIINARNDPFMGRGCFPIEEAQKNPNLFLEMPDSGGHLGFITFPSNQPGWIEKRLLAFLKDVC